MTSTADLKPYLKGKKLNKIEKNKASKDGLMIGNELEKFAEIGWEKMDKIDLELRLKWYGLFWRPKTPGKFMLRIRIPNGILNSQQLKVIASIVARYGENGSCDITTRQNLQLRGILINDFPEILKRLNKVGINTIQSGFDNPRNITGNPLAGIDPEEIVDTRPYTQELDNFLTSQGLGNNEFSNLPRKWNTAVAGAKDNFLLHNDLIFHPTKLNNEMGFGVWVGGILSSQLNEYAIPLNAWVKDNEICQLTGSILSIWRDHGERDKRTKGRFRFYLEQVGLNNFREQVVEKFGTLKQDPGSEFRKKPRSLFGINPQKQPEYFYAGLHIPVGRLTSEDLQELAEISINYGSEEIRLTEDQNIIIVGIHKIKVKDFQIHPLLNKFHLNPNHIEAGTVSCTGNKFCSFALTNTKETAAKISKILANELELRDEIKIHWTGCPNSCGQAYMGAIGLTGKKAKNSAGKIVEAFDISIGGSQGPINKIGNLKYKSIPSEELIPILKNILIKDFKAIPKRKPNLIVKLIYQLKKLLGSNST